MELRLLSRSHRSNTKLNIFTVQNIAALYRSFESSRAINLARTY